MRFALFMPGQCRKTDRFPRASSKAVLTTLLVVNRWAKGSMARMKPASSRKHSVGNVNDSNRLRWPSSSPSIRKRCEDSDIEVTHVLSRSSFAEQYLPRLRHRDDAKRGLLVLRR